eukprot:TRINITY_DN3533_c0_g1_i1.p1 TRINITY_DN3533_c0_g1~~TRINITY_DN3533_c0_g1_i1.p1  ORF type:complete len:385 (-),score=101.21 TRINITY_DN3533_c0_g1_i1:63-1217(-)
MDISKVARELTECIRERLAHLRSKSAQKIAAERAFTEILSEFEHQGHGEHHGEHICDHGCDHEGDYDEVIELIQAQLRDEYPVSGLAPNEKLVFPLRDSDDDDGGDEDGKGENPKEIEREEKTRYSVSDSAYVDGFLYDDDVLDTLVEEGKASRNVCLKCGSKEVKPLNFFTHSLTLTQCSCIVDVVGSLLGSWDHKVVVDVGSRLGPLLYVGYLKTDGSTIDLHSLDAAPTFIGIEKNDVFCKSTTNIVDKFNMKARVQIVCSDVLDALDITSHSDCVVFHNVFECFESIELEREIWKKLLSEGLKDCSVIVFSPSLDDVIKRCDMKDDPIVQEFCEKWVAVPAELDDEDLKEEMEGIHFYIHRKQKPKQKGRKRRHNRSKRN